MDKLDKLELERQEQMDESSITEDELKVVGDASLTSCIFGDTSYSLDSTIDRMKQRFDAIAARIDSLEHSKYSKLSMVKNEIAMGLYLIHTEKLYLASNYKSVFEFGKDVLDFTRMTTTNYIRVAKRFIDKKRPVSVFYLSNTGIDFNISQLIQLLKLTDDEINTALERDMLDVTMSVSQIKTLVQIMKERRATVQAEQVKADMEPIQAAYDEFHKAYNTLKERLASDTESCELMQTIMDSMVVLYVECTKDK